VRAGEERSRAALWGALLLTRGAADRLHCTGARSTAPKTVCRRERGQQNCRTAGYRLGSLLGVRCAPCSLLARPAGWRICALCALIAVRRPQWHAEREASRPEASRRGAILARPSSSAASHTGHSAQLATPPRCGRAAAARPSAALSCSQSPARTSAPLDGERPRMRPCCCLLRAPAQPSELLVARANAGRGQMRAQSPAAAAAKANRGSQRACLCGPPASLPLTAAASRLTAGRPVQPCRRPAADEWNIGSHRERERERARGRKFLLLESERKKEKHTHTANRQQPGSGEKASGEPTTTLYCKAARLASVRKEKLGSSLSLSVLLVN